MGKVIVIKDADFSGVAVERIEYDAAKREVFAVIENDGYYYDNKTADAAPIHRKFNGYGSQKVDVSAFVGYKVLVSAACGSTAAIIRIDNAEDVRLYYKNGSDETPVRDEVIIPAGAKWAYLNNYFHWDASPFSYIYEP